MRNISITDRDPVLSDKMFTLHAEVTSEGHQDLRRAVIIIPPMGAITWADRYLARALARQGARTYILKDFTPNQIQRQDWRVHADGLLRGQHAVSLLKNFARIDSGLESISLVGSSMGALYCAMSAALSDGVDRLALLAGGLPISEIAAHSLHPQMVALRRLRFRESGVRNVEDYVRRLREAIPLDLADVIEPRAGRKDLVAVGLRDTIVPTKTQFQLVEKLHRPTVLKFKANHRLTIFAAQLWQTDALVTHLL